MSQSTLEYLDHILEEADYLIKTSDQLSYNEFVNDPTLTRAFIRSLEIIGEAVKKIPKEFRQKYPSVTWKDMAGMRDVLIHRYSHVDLELVWDVIQDDIPKLKKQIANIIQDLEEE